MDKDNRLLEVYNIPLLGGFDDRDESKLRVAISMSEIKKASLSPIPLPGNTETTKAGHALFAYNTADIAKEINPSYKNIIKYFPDGLLDAERRAVRHAEREQGVINSVILTCLYMNVIRLQKVHDLPKYLRP